VVVVVGGVNVKNSVRPAGAAVIPKLLMERK